MSIPSYIRIWRAMLLCYIVLYIHPLPLCRLKHVAWWMYCLGAGYCTCTTLPKYIIYSILHGDHFYRWYIDAWTTLSLRSTVVIIYTHPKGVSYWMDHNNWYIRSWVTIPVYCLKFWVRWFWSFSTSCHNAVIEHT